MRCSSTAPSTGTARTRPPRRCPRPSVSAPADPTPTPDPAQSQPSQQDPGQQNPAAPVNPERPAAQDLTDDQQAAVAAVSPGLVDIVSTIGYDGAQGAGTGVVLTSDGLVLTNHHVVAGSTSLRVTDIGNGKTYTAKVLGYDARTTSPSSSWPTPPA